MMNPKSVVRSIRVGGAVVATVLAGIVIAATISPSPKLVTNTTGGKNQNATIDKSGKLIVFTSNVNDLAASTFDFDGAGNDFKAPLGTPPDPSCVNCSNADANGELYLWRLKAKGGDPANSIKQLTFTTGGGFDANQLPDIAQKGAHIAWASDRDHTGGNADANREIFSIAVSTGTITQVTSSTGGGSNANRNASISDDGNVIVFDSTRDYNGVGGCTLTDGTTACDNADGNSEVMLWDRKLNKLTQVTVTTGDGTSANIRPRVSPEGLFIGFQSTRDFAAPAVGTCTLLDGTSACINTGAGVLNSEIMLFDVKLNKFTQVTNTTTAGGCTGAGANERVEISKKGKFVSFQSTCESQLNPTPACGDCDGNDEAFIADTKGKLVRQVTISKSGFNRVPRIAGGGAWMIMESNRNYKNLNPTHAKVLYVLKRSTKLGVGGFTGPGQLLDDPSSTLVQSLATKLVVVNLVGGFNSTVEQFGAATGGRFFSFDNNKAVGNQEVWFLDRNK